MADENDITFIKITNKDIYKKLEMMHQEQIKIGNMVKLNRRWLWALTGAFSTGFLFLVSLIK